MFNCFQKPQSLHCICPFTKQLLNPGMLKTCHKAHLKLDLKRMALSVPSNFLDWSVCKAET